MPRIRKRRSVWAKAPGDKPFSRSRGGEGCAADLPRGEGRELGGEGRELGGEGRGPGGGVALVGDTAGVVVVRDMILATLP